MKTAVREVGLERKPNHSARQSDNQTFIASGSSKAICIKFGKFEGHLDMLTRRSLSVYIYIYIYQNGLDSFLFAVFLTVLSNRLAFFLSIKFQ